MKQLKTLHLASFEGNVGDNANHSGTRAFLERNLTDFQIEYTELEIREFFWKERKFDDQFVEFANQFDFIIIGGGNYFELWVDDSCNGTTIDLSIDLLKSIKPPILFNALGLDPAQGVTEKRINNFKTWLDFVLFNEKYLVSLRNDGSMEAAREILGEPYVSKFHHVPDGGFFTKVKSFYHPEIPNDKKIIGINLAGDMLDIRFDTARGENYINDETYLTDLGGMFNELLSENEEIHLVFYCHIYKDLEFTSRFLYKLSDRFCRKRVTLAPYLHGAGAEHYIFDSYKQCHLIVGHRFHTNVCAIGLHIPTVGLVNYRQIEKLYEELDLTDRMVKVNIDGFTNALKDKIVESLKNEKQVVAKYEKITSQLANQLNGFHSQVNNWLKKNIN